MKNSSSNDAGFGAVRNSFLVGRSTQFHYRRTAARFFELKDNPPHSLTSAISPAAQSLSFDGNLFPHCRECAVHTFYKSPERGYNPRQASASATAPSPHGWPVQSDSSTFRHLRPRWVPRRPSTCHELTHQAIFRRHFRRDAVTRDRPRRIASTGCGTRMKGLLFCLILSFLLDGLGSTIGWKLRRWRAGPGIHQATAERQ